MLVKPVDQQCWRLKARKDVQRRRNQWWAATLLHPTTATLATTALLPSLTTASVLRRRNRDGLCGRLGLPISEPKLFKPTTLICTNLSKNHNGAWPSFQVDDTLPQDYSHHRIHIYTCPSVSLAFKPQNARMIMRSHLPQVVQFIYVQVVTCATRKFVYILEGGLSPCKVSQEASQIYLCAKKPDNNSTSSSLSLNRLDFFWFFRSGFPIV